MADIPHPPTSAGRPDVAAIEARAKKAVSIDRLYAIAQKDIPALIAYIKVLETRMEKLELKVEEARLVAETNNAGAVATLLKVQLIRKRLAALGDGDG